MDTLTTQERSRRMALAAVTAAAMLAGTGLAGCGSAQKADLDREVDRLCAIDGGVHIYEVVRLPKEDFGPDGEVFPQYRLRFPKGELGPDYLSTYKVIELVSGDPSLQRIQVLVTRVADGRKLGEFIDYKRSGGDLPGPSEPSRKSCPTSRDSGAFHKRIFLQEK